MFHITSTILGKSIFFDAIDSRVQDALNGCLASTNEAVQEVAFELFPNPCTNDLSITLEGVSQNSYAFEVFSLDGKLALNGSLKSNSSNLDVTNLSPGVYYFRIVGMNEIGMKKFIIE